MEDKFKGYKGEEVLLVYLEDNNEQVSAWVTIVSIENNLITFTTNRNTISIPVSRIIKIKRRGE